jgi:anthranilate phosphoribosyltransferase
MITEFIQSVVDGKNLSEADAREVMGRIMSGEASDPEIAAFLTALRMKGETVDELVGFARVMRARAVPFWDGQPATPVVDTCGTGGDRSGTFNISTAAAFVAAGAGAKVAKHGNRSISSRSGSADVLEALGIDIQMPPERLRRAIDEVGIAFLFAQAFHKSMKYVMPARTAIRIRTVFNFLGPLSNPARADFQVVGVNDAAIVELMASALGRLGARHAFVVHGEGGLDEVSIAGPTSVIEVTGHDLRHMWIKPEDFGIPTAPLEAILGGDPALNAGIIRDVLGGKTGPHRDAVLINAMFAVVAAGLAGGLPEGLAVARDAIDSGRAMEKLEGLKALSES